MSCIHINLITNLRVSCSRPQNRSSWPLTIDWSIWGKYRSTRLIDSTFGPSHDSARLSAKAIDSIDLTDFILDSSVVAYVFYKILLTFHRDFSYTTHMWRVSVFVSKLCCSCFILHCVSKKKHVTTFSIITLIMVIFVFCDFPR